MLHFKRVVFLCAFTCILFFSKLIYAQAELVDDIHDYEALSLAKNLHERKSNPPKWRLPRNTETAMNNPDLYAWQLFTAMNWPVSSDRCVADREKQIGDEGLTTWEAWPARQQIFIKGAVKPERWRVACRERLPALPEGNFSVFADETVRVNRASYRYIVNNKLYSLDEQERLVKAGVRDLDFPLGSKEIKAYWVIINEADKPRYHWREIERDDETVIYGLSAFHISSKESPTWFWSTFEHVDNELVWPMVYPDAFLGWSVPSVDSVACPQDNLSCNKIPTGFGLEGTKWENYRLRATQVDWIDNRGNPTIAANSQLEFFIQQQTSSCITCHALAVRDLSGKKIPISITIPSENPQELPFGHIGAINPELFLDENGQELPYLGLDYVWTLRNAVREE